MSASPHHPDLPAPIDIPPPPAGAASPGGEGLPPMAGAGPEGAPAISAISEITFPGETLVVTGEGLDGATLRVWAEGTVFPIEPLRTASNRLQAVVPTEVEVDGATRPTPRSTMLVWPEKDGRAGAPIRVNAPAAWWVWPRRLAVGAGERSARLFGKNLLLEGAKPRVVAEAPDGSQVELEIGETTPYCIGFELPADAARGRWRARLHNGTGGEFGWSESVWLEATDGLPVPDRVFHVDDYGPSEDPLVVFGRAPKMRGEDGIDDTERIQLAILDASRQGGGVVQFGPGQYRVARKIVVPEGPPVVLRGAGIGEWTAFGQGIVSGEATDIRDNFRGRNDLFRDDAFFELRADGARIENMNLIMRTVADIGIHAFHNAKYSEGAIIEEQKITLEQKFRSCVRMAGHDQTLDGVRLVSMLQGTSLVQCDRPGAAGHNILNCEIYMGSGCVDIQDETDFVRVQGCKMRGHVSEGRGTVGADAIVNWGGSHIIVEDCHFQSEDRTHSKILSRTYLAYSNSSRCQYLANNRSEWVGGHSTCSGMEGNIAEQYLFHTQHNDVTPDDFDIAGATEQTITLDADPLIMPKGIWYDRKFYVFIARGRGAGQFRVVDGAFDDGEGRITLHVDKPWRVVPEAGGRADVNRAFRQNIVYGNLLNPAPDPSTIEPEFKTVGIYWYHNCFDNVTANNTLRNIGSGVAIANSPNTPCGWNVTRENEFENVTGVSGGSSRCPMFYNEHARGFADKPMRQWFSVGNVCRANKGHGADAAFQIGFLGHDKTKGRFPEDFEPDTESGLMSPVVENNEFTDVDRGVLLSPTSNWALARNNRVVPRKDGVEIYEHVDKEKIRDLLVIEPEAD